MSCGTMRNGVVYQSLTDVQECRQGEVDFKKSVSAVGERLGWVRMDCTDWVGTMTNRDHVMKLKIDCSNWLISGGLWNDLEVGWRMI